MEWFVEFALLFSSGEIPLVVPTNFSFRVGDISSAERGLLMGDPQGRVLTARRLGLALLSSSGGISINGMCNRLVSQWGKSQRRNEDSEWGKAQQWKVSTARGIIKREPVGDACIVVSELGKSQQQNEDSGEIPAAKGFDCL